MVRTYVTQAQLAQTLCISLKTLQNRLSAYPESLPKPVCLLGSRTKVWDPLAIEAWQNAMLTGGAAAASAHAVQIIVPKEPVKRRRGRPSNAERAARGEFASV